MDNSVASVAVVNLRCAMSEWVPGWPDGPTSGTVAAPLKRNVIGTAGNVSADDDRHWS